MSVGTCLCHCIAARVPGARGLTMKTQQHTAQHTPGPWQFDGLDKIIGDQGNAEVCQVWGAAVEDQDGYANARIIAAAPDLLEACKCALNSLDMIGATRGSPITTQLRAAIAKAEGQ